jgi:hypothetical protein
MFSIIDCHSSLLDYYGPFGVPTVPLNAKINASFRPSTMLDQTIYPSTCLSSETMVTLHIRAMT